MAAFGYKQTSRWVVIYVRFTPESGRELRHLFMAAVDHTLPYHSQLMYRLGGRGNV